MLIMLLAKQDTFDSQYMEYINKYVVVSCKLLVELHVTRPAPFEPLLVPCLEMMWGELASMSIEQTNSSQIKQSRYLQYLLHHH